MNETELSELTDSIRTHGVIQPILVRPLGADWWEIVAGERRFRAAKLAGFQEIPVVIRDIRDEEALVLALIENMQRSNLSPIEEAMAANRLIKEFDYSHNQVAQAIGRSRSATSNLLRLLGLAPTVRQLLGKGDIDVGHARALLSIDEQNQTEIANEVVEKKLSVREVEKRIQRLLDESVRHKEETTQEWVEESAPVKKGQGDSAKTTDFSRLEETLSDLLSAPVSIRANRKGIGELAVKFFSKEDLCSIIKRFHVKHRKIP